MTITSPEVDAFTADEEVLIERAQALRDQLRAHAADADTNRELATEDIQAMNDAGLMSMMTPKRFGGSEVSLRTLVDVTRTLGQGDMSAGWEVGVHGASAFVMASFPEETQQEVWANGPTTLLSGVLSPAGQSERVEGGVRISGKWPYMSGVVSADWVFMAAPIGGALGPGVDMGFVLLPKSDITVEDTWYVTGMRATASRTAVVNDVFVPDHHILLWRDYRPDTSPGLYRSNIFSVLCIGLVGTIVGGAEHALEIVEEKAPKRSITTTTYRVQTDSPAFHLEVGRAAQKIQAAKLTAEKAAKDMDDIIAEDRYATELDKAQNRADIAWTADEVWNAVDQLATSYGTSTFAQGTDLERIWRNAAVASRHAGFNERVGSEIIGRAILGLDPTEVGPTL